MPRTISKLNLLFSYNSGTYQHLKIIFTMLKKGPQHHETPCEVRKQPYLPSRLGSLKVFQLTKIVSSFKRTTSSFCFETNVIWYDCVFLLRSTSIGIEGRKNLAAFLDGNFLPAWNCTRHVHGLVVIKGNFTMLAPPEKGKPCARYV